jgi:hypothetical protein
MIWLLANMAFRNSGAGWPDAAWRYGGGGIMSENPMAYKVQRNSHGEYVVLFYFPWDEAACSDVFWSQDIEAAEAECARRNEEASIIHATLHPKFLELVAELKERPGNRLTSALKHDSGPTVAPCQIS